ncbi:hypothetical protein GCM10022225_59490 [Plantactinospora mayteni]|uniref:Uncharacterized protein n=1 Tax=Plantactinospora mayteni TaxID=566021 RepID=A0ABQ4EKB7_9ACTN|nr:hypothetical protein [Plantactinospora mayteni]GIG95200.1 hypothetical protein Pma05_17730 [Plantactinospora mayteni]
MNRAQTLGRKAATRLVADPPEWLRTLRRDAATQDLGVSWHDDDTIAEETEDADERPSDWGLHTQATRQHIRLNRPHLVPVAAGPEYTRRGMGTESDATWYVDSRDPQHLLFAPSPEYPPFLHVPAGTTAEQMAQVLRGFFPVPRPTRVTLPKVARGFLGYLGRLGVPSPYTGQVEGIDGLTLDRYYTMNLYTEVNSWGSAFFDDPYPEEWHRPIEMIGLGREAMKQADAVPSKTWRTAHSGSYLTIEAHDGELLVGEVRYRSNTYPEVVEKLNATFGSYFPTDLPVDVIGALLGFDFQTIDMLERELAEETDPGKMLGQLHIATALAYGDLDAFARLRPHFDHDNPSYRAQAMNFLLSYNYAYVLEELAHTEPEEQLSEQLHRVLNRGINSRHPDIFEGGADYDYDDEDEDDE